MMILESKFRYYYEKAKGIKTYSESKIIDFSITLLDEETLEINMTLVGNKSFSIKIDTKNYFTYFEGKIFTLEEFIFDNVSEFFDKYMKVMLGDERRGFSLNLVILKEIIDTKGQSHYFLELL